MSYVQARLNKELKARDLTVTEAAKMLGIGRPALSNVLNGNAELSVELALRFEHTFHLNAYKLLMAQLKAVITETRDNMKTSDD